MINTPDGNAIVYCEGAFRTTYGKTAHGLVRRTSRYRIVAVIDSTCAGYDAGKMLEGKPVAIPIVSDLAAALLHAERQGSRATHFVIGLAPDGGKLSVNARADIMNAIRRGLHVDSGLHDFLSDDQAIAALAARHGVQLRDIRKPPERRHLHFFEGKISQVDSLKIAVLGTDSAIGKRTTAWLLTDALNAAGHRAEFVGTGQTAWLQGAHYGIILDSLINDFVAGEIEHAVWRAWHEVHPAAIVIEGQGSMMNPAYPGGFEILAAARPDVVILQHAPARREYDGFPGFPLHPLEQQIRAIELISGKPVVAVTINHEDLTGAQIPAACNEITRTTGLPAFDVLKDGAQALVECLFEHLC